MLTLKLNACAADAVIDTCDSVQIGHLEAASGIAGLVKTVLMLEKGKVLPNRNFETPSKRIPFEDWRLKVPTEVEDFGVSGPVIASVNSFGYGGSNAHAVLQDTSSFIKVPDADAITNGSSNGTTTNVSRPDKAADGTWVFVLSAFEQQTIQKQAVALANFLQAREEDEDALLQDLSYTLLHRRTRFPFTATIHADTKGQLISVLTEGNIKGTRQSKHNTPALGFVFTGQGAQWWGMGRELFARFPVFARSIAASEAELQRLGSTWKLEEELFKDAQSTRVNEAEISQPVCTALQVALVDLLASLSIRPAAVTGHSSGEIAAAYCAGALTLEDAVAAAYHRGLMSKLANERCPVPGAMMAVGMSEQEAIPLIEGLQKGKAVIACVNSAKSITISGDAAALDELKTILTTKRVFARKLAVQVAYHSHHMAYVAQDYLDAVAHIQPQAASPENNGCVFYSSVTGQEAPLKLLGPQYWVDNMLGQVKFESSLRDMCQAKDITVLCEVGPHSALAGPARQVLTSDGQLREKGIPILSALIRGRNAVQTIADVMCSLNDAGFSPDLSALNSSVKTAKTAKPLSSLPPYPWSHSQSYWAESRVSKEYRQRPFIRSDILGVPIRHFNPAEPRWRHLIKIQELPWIKDHKIQGTVVYPAAGFLAMAIEAVAQQTTQRSGGGSPSESKSASSFELREVTIGQALVIPDDSGEAEIIFSMRPFSTSVQFPSDVWNEFSISSVSPDNRWTEHARGLVRAHLSSAKESRSDEVSTESQVKAEKARIAEFVAAINEGVESVSKESIDIGKFYSQLADLGLEYGPTFANLVSVRAGNNSQDANRKAAVATLKVTDTASCMPGGFEYPFEIHPAILDSLFHPLFAAIGTLNDPYVPILINRLVLDTRMRTTAGVKLDSFTEAKTLDQRQISASTVVFDKVVSADSPVLQIEGLTCIKIARDRSSQASASETDTSGRRQAPYGHRVVWRPDVDLQATMNPDHLNSLCQVGYPSAQEGACIDKLEEAGYWLMKSALAQLAEHESNVLKKALPYHKRFYECMKLRVAEHDDRYHGRNPDEAITHALKEGGAEADLLVHMGRNLAAIIRQERDALVLMMEEGRLDRYHGQNARLERNYGQLARYLSLAAHKNPGLRILEIGAGTGGATLPVLQALSSEDDEFYFGRWTFTDVNPDFFEAAQQKLARWEGMVEYKKLDVESDPTTEEQGFEEGGYDVILAANVLRLTPSMETTMRNVRKLLRPGGKLVLVEHTRERFVTSTIFGTLPVWFNGGEAERVRGPTLTEDQWDDLLKKTGFAAGLDLVVWDTVEERHHQGSVMVATSTAAIAETVLPEGHQPEFVIVHEEPTPGGLVSVSQLSDWLGSQVPFAIIRQACLGSLATFDPTGKVVIVLTELSSATLDSPKDDGIFDSIKSIFTSSAAVLWVTRGAWIESTNPVGAMATGFARTVKSEYGTNTVLTLDLDPSPGSGEDTAAHWALEAIKSLLLHHILSSNAAKVGEQSDTYESEYAERAGGLLIPRLVPDKPLQRSMTSLLGTTTNSGLPRFETVPFSDPTGTRNLVVEVETPGLLDTIHFVDDVRLDPSSLDELTPGIVEISIKASGINSKDAMMAMGQIGGTGTDRLGLECSGVVRRVGPDVSSLRVGDRVATYGFGTFATTLRRDANACQKIPDSMSFELAASLPITFMTAHHSVVSVARLRRGQSVLIHAASGGLGQALIEICKLQFKLQGQDAGAAASQIYCTVGTVEKKKLLMETYGIPEANIFTSRDQSFAEGLKRATGGRGVDVIFNSVAGEMLRLTWECIAPFGVFVELGARDYTANTRLEMSRLARNVTFAAVNLSELVKERPEAAARLWEEVMHLFKEQQVNGPTPLARYGVHELEGALRLMHSGKHMGKLVLVMDDNNSMVRARVSPPSPSLKKDRKLFKPDVSYLLAGGMGGIGRAMAMWMLEQGVVNFVFASRSGLDRREAQELKARLEESGRDAGVRVLVAKCDISVKGHVERLKAEIDGSGFPPVRGVLQNAMILRDSFLSTMKVVDYEAVVRPKVAGTWNLHQVFGTELDLFVMLSSAVGVIGNASQAAYAASSTFLDAFASYRRSQGLAASVIDLGVVDEIGYVAENEHLARAFERRGFEGTGEREIMALLHSAIVAGNDESLSSHLVTGLGTWRQGESLDAFERPLFARFRHLSLQKQQSQQSVQVGDNDPLRGVSTALKGAKTRESAIEIITRGLMSKMSSLGMVALEDISPDRPLAEYGMDSLVAVEMRTWISREMDAAVPVLELMANEPMRVLAGRILAKSRLVASAALLQGEEGGLSV